MDKRRIEMNVLNAFWDNETIDGLIEEFEVRKLRIAKRQELLKKRELEQLARLKAKYE